MSHGTTSAVDEINQFYDEATRRAGESREQLDHTITAAWRAGQLLLVERKRVRRAMGRDAWSLWLEQNFRGSPAVARRYIRVAESAADESALRGLSIRQTYLRLGIATEPKCRAQSFRVPALPAHLRLAGRLLVALHPQRDFRRLTPTSRALLQQDLRPIYVRLHALFEPTIRRERASAGFSSKHQFVREH